jgi:hypothetical protein
MIMLLCSHIVDALGGHRREGAGRKSRLDMVEADPIMDAAGANRDDVGNMVANLHNLFEERKVGILARETDRRAGQPTGKITKASLRRTQMRDPFQEVAFPVEFDCNTKAMKYVIHGGWGNQVAGMQRAMLLANILNRTLLIPPVLKHSEMAYGKCPASQQQLKARGATPTHMRQKAEVHFGRICGRSGASAVDLFDRTVLNGVARTVGWAQWQRQCKGVVGAEDIQTVDHDCSDKMRWEVPEDVRVDYKTNRIINDPWVVENGGGGRTGRPVPNPLGTGRQPAPPAQVNEWPERIAMLRQSDKTLLHFSSLFSYTLYSDSYLGVSWDVVSRNIVYHHDLWKVPCALSREVAPYATMHIRGGDGAFRKNKKFSRSILQQMSVLTNHLEGSKLYLDTLHRNTNMPGCNFHNAAQNRTLRLMIVTDMKWEKLAEKLPDFGEVLARSRATIAPLGWRMQLSTTRNQYGTAFALQLLEVSAAMPV